MQTSRSKIKDVYVFVEGSVPAMLRSTKALLSDKQYKDLCNEVNNAEGYQRKKEIIFQYVEPIISK